MEKDHRYDLVKILIDNGEIKSFAQIFKYIPKSIVGRDLGIDHRTVGRRLKVPRSISLIHFFKLRELIDCDRYKLLDIFFREKGKR
jgi:hypothetical protein